MANPQQHRPPVRTDFIETELRGRADFFSLVPIRFSTIQSDPMKVAQNSFQHFPRRSV